MAPHSNILAWKIPWTEELMGYSPWGHKESDATELARRAANSIEAPFLSFFLSFFPLIFLPPFLPPFLLLLAHLSTALSM